MTNLDLSTAILDTKIPNSMLIKSTPLVSLKLNQHEIGVNPLDAYKLNLFDCGPVKVLGKKQKEEFLILKCDKSVEEGTVFLIKETRNNLNVRSGDMVKIYEVPDKKIKKATYVSIAAIDETVKSLEGDIFTDFIAPYFDSINFPFVTKGSIYRIAAGVMSIEVKVTEVKSSEEAEEMHGIVEESTIINATETIRRSEVEKEQAKIGYDDIGGCRRQMAQIRECVELPLKHPELFTKIGIVPPRGILLHGPPGTGKTQIAKAIANECGSFLLVINGPEIMSKMNGESESNLRKAFETAAENSPAIIFIDEIDSIAPSREKSSQESEKRIVAQLLTLMDGMNSRNNVIVLGATNRPNSLDPALRRFGRFDREIEIGVPDELGRLEILSIHTKNMRLSKDVDLHSIAKEIQGFTGSDVASMCSEAAIQQLREKLPYIDLDREKIPSKILADLSVTQQNFNYAIQNTDPSSLRETVIETPNVKWVDIGGLENVKMELRETVMYPVNHPEKFLKFGQLPSKGVLLYGPPGCGKTLLAKAVATECKANFIAIKGPELLSKWVGDSESNVRQLFDKARGSAPCVLFFDEIDSIGKSRMHSSDSSGVTDRMLNQLLVEMDGMNQKKNVFVMGATNRPNLLDTALMRPGRLDQLVYIPLPDKQSRLSILKAKLSKAPLGDDVNLDSIAEMTEGFSGADLTEICQRAAKFAIRESIRAEISKNSEDDPVPFLSNKFFSQAMKTARKSVTLQEIQGFEAFAKSMNVSLTLDKTGQPKDMDNDELYD